MSVNRVEILVSNLFGIINAAKIVRESSVGQRNRVSYGNTKFAHLSSSKRIIISISTPPEEPFPM